MIKKSLFYVFYSYLNVVVVKSKPQVYQPLILIRNLCLLKTGEVIVATVVW